MEEWSETCHLCGATVVYVLGPKQWYATCGGCRGWRAYAKPDVVEKYGAKK